MYQTMSPDNLGSSSVRKSNTSNIKSNKEDHQNVGESGRTASSSVNGSTLATNIASTSFDANGVTRPKPHQQQQLDYHLNHNHQPAAASTSSAAHQTHESSPSRSGACLGSSGSGDGLLQWGQRKRSRCSRTEGRSSVSAVLEKHHTNTTTDNHVMPHPPPHPNPNLTSVPSTSSNGGSRSGGSSRVRPGLFYPKDIPLSKNRNLVDQMGTNSASPSRNGGGSSRPIVRSTVGKRSPSFAEKNDTKVSSSGVTKKVKSDDYLVPPTSNGNHVEVGHGEQEHGGGGGAASMVRSPLAEAENGGGSEVVEWPRIHLSLSRKEKEEDFYAMKGTKLPNRPKKRAKAVDRALQFCFPGVWLSDLSKARYEVRERKSAKKPKRRGLKGLENMESESE